MDRQARIIRTIQAVATDSITPTPEQSLFESGLLDSFTLPDLVTALEKEFGLSIPDSDLTPRKFDSVVRIEAYLASKGK